MCNSCRGNIGLTAVAIPNTHDCTNRIVLHLPHESQLFRRVPRVRTQNTWRVELRRKQTRRSRIHCSLEKAVSAEKQRGHRGTTTEGKD